ncbi:5-methylthioadenosine/S-adenosylhomocysteine deaminase n1 [Mycena indigotica]|uniref:5-methylthioadenosine/S-adenosylhomocysteine deaminase n1 n=1 Tax=Mycena indigotica TaxID=2126181 RepID=A0A8H6S9D0_9AGAR|nr:5-methylthioadenosine/S-adenosylhomocysteine deaminase n1 [Mycena indigotica]KAF7294536.1 5-methylthioadenosine/S-adenosylhomocysteine deaminase n1 [Mycena indigotica]
MYISDDSRSISVMASILLNHGTILLHDDNDHITPVKSDLLVVGNEIAEIRPQINGFGKDTVILDCTGKVVSPGFIDTHHHVWQTQLKGRHANATLLDYMPRGNSTGALYNAEDVFWGELAGCLEAIDGGTTMLVDHAHITHGPLHAPNAISATVSSGIRSIYGYCDTPNVTSWNPLTFAAATPDYFDSQLADLAKQQPFGDGRVQLGLAFDSFFLPKEMVIERYKSARSLGIKLVTSHYARGPVVGQHSVVELLEAYGLLGPDILLSHASNATPNDAALLASANAHVSTTPETELQAALGFPVAFRDDLHGVASLGVDSHSNNSGDMLTQMRLALQAARGARNQSFVDAGKNPNFVKHTVEAAFNLGTIKGARAVGMEGQIGSIAVGKLADLVVFDGESPAMVCAAEHDPVAAIVMHASIRDIEAVIVDGKIRKSGGKLLAVQGPTGGNLEWKTVAQKLMESRTRIEAEYRKIDMKSATARIMEVFQMKPENFVDSL